MVHGCECILVQIPQFINHLVCVSMRHMVSSLLPILPLLSFGILLLPILSIPLFATHRQQVDKALQTSQLSQCQATQQPPRMSPLLPQVPQWRISKATMITPIMPTKTTIWILIPPTTQNLRVKIWLDHVVHPKINPTSHAFRGSIEVVPP